MSAMMKKRPMTTSPVSCLTSMRIVSVIAVCLLGFVRLSAGSGNDGIPITNTLAVINVEVNEEEDQMTELGPNPLITCVDEDPTRAYISSMTPSSPCSERCFLIKSCGTTEGEFCLYYVPGKGSLTYSVAPTYSLSIACADDVETPVAKTLTVTVKSNTPPDFSPSTPLTISRTKSGTTTVGNTVLYDVTARDIDDDPIYYTMGLNPNTEYLTMGYSDGRVYATNNLLFLCESTVESTVSITDSYNPSVGPLTIDWTFSPHNTAPSTTNLDTTISYDELTAAGTVVHPITIVDDGFGTVLSNLRSTSDAGLEMYELTAAGVALRIEADYERTDTRSIVLYMDYTDGYCNSKTYSLTLNILDVNEPPVFHPAELRSLVVYEGDINVVPPVEVWDPDGGETFTYTRDAGSAGFSVDSTTGAIMATNFDIDPKRETMNRFIRYTVTDSGGLTDTIQVGILVLDANDNPPVFDSAAYVLGATTCTELGRAIGRVRATDQDSPLNNNDAFNFYGGGGRMAVASNGQVILTEQCVEGQTTYGTANVRDHGIYPSALDGVPATLTLVCGACPPPVTAAPVTATVATVTVATASTPALSHPSDPDVDEFLSWVIPAAILAALWVALTIYFLYRFCRPCNCRRAPKPVKVKPQKKVAQPKPAEPPKPKPKPPPPEPKPETPPPPPPPPPPPATPPQPYVYSFWQENYTDQDYRDGKKPGDANVAKPKAVEQMPTDIVRGNEPPPDHLKLGNPTTTTTNAPAPTNPAASKAPKPPPPKSSSFCAVL